MFLKHLALLCPPKLESPKVSKVAAKRQRCQRVRVRLSPLVRVMITSLASAAAAQHYQEAGSEHQKTASLAKAWRHGAVASNKNPRVRLKLEQI